MDALVLLYCLYLILNGLKEEIEDYYCCGNRPA